jgi:adenosylcobinamide kinase/adenosylcobinamide-phosphate guanylyltransferase
MIALIGGGVRCGKSAFALALARGLGPRRLFIATAQAFDDEMRARIASHRVERAREFETLEVPLELPEALARAQADVVVIDCLTLWLSNLLLAEASDAEIEARVNALGEALVAARSHSVLVTNEVGMGIVPENALARRFRDASGRAHQRLAALSDQLYFGALGSMLRLRPAPICLQRAEDLHVTTR